MMVETILESSQDFGMTNGSLPQWKRELLQRRAARARPGAPAAPPPPPPPPPPAPPASPPPADGNEDEELRYGPGIVKRLKSRYLSLALRDAPRRRPSVLRRAASLEHLLDERPPPAPRPSARAPRPAPPAPPQPAARRDSVKRARSVDALSRLEPSPPPARAPRPPRRPAPLLRDAERPPPDTVRAALRKFEAAPTRRVAPAVRASAARRSPTPEPAPPPPRTPPPSTPPPALPPPPPPRIEVDVPPPASPEPRVETARVETARVEPPQAEVPPTPAAAESAPEAVNLEVVAGGGGAGAARAVSRAALEGIARAGSSVRFAFSGARGGSHLPPLGASAAAPARRVGVIRPLPPAAPAGRAGSPPPRGQPGRGAGRAAPGTTSVVFDFSDRKEVPDYIENDGIILRSSRRNKLKARAGSESDPEEPDGGEPEPCRVRFLNDNVLINGRSSMPAPARRDALRRARLKLQFDDSLTRTFEYPSETSFGEEPPPASPPASPPPGRAPSPAHAHTHALVDNTHIGMSSLSRYTPSKTAACAFQLGVTCPPPAPAPSPAPAPAPAPSPAPPLPPAEEPRAWSEARALHADLLF